MCLGTRNSKGANTFLGMRCQRKFSFSLSSTLNNYKIGSRAVVEDSKVKTEFFLIFLVHKSQVHDLKLACSTCASFSDISDQLIRDWVCVVVFFLPYKELRLCSLKRKGCIFSVIVHATVSFVTFKVIFF